MTGHNMAIMMRSMSKTLHLLAPDLIGFLARGGVLIAFVAFWYSRVRHCSPAALAGQ